MSRTRLSLIRIAPVAIVLAGCPRPPEASFEVSQISPASELALGPGDIFEVHVFGEPDLSGTYKVASDGTIDYPLIGQVRVEDLVPHQAATLITGKLAEKYLKSPQVSILVKEQTSKKIIVIGQVAHPGTFPFASNMTIVEAITVAGGFTPIASKNHISITRVEAGRKISIEVPVAEIGEGKAKNVLLRAGDIISVPERLF
jgi:polysaccharide export outer membrane protein